MNEKRIELQFFLEKIIGCKNVYFQPPESLKLKYPCIVYELSDEFINRADDINYSEYDLYSVTLIDKNPDTCFRKPLRDLEHCSFDRYYVLDGLNHYIYRLYY